MQGTHPAERSASASPGPEARTRPGTLVAYAAPQLTTSLLFTAVGMYLLKFTTDVLLLSPALIGLIFGLSRFWDAITDPVVGYLSDRTRSRFGRRRPWMVLSAIPVALAYVSIWAPPPALGPESLPIWIGAAIVLFYTFMTTFSVPYTALGAEISTGYHDRTRVFGARAIGDYLGIILSAATILVLERAPDARSAAAWLASASAVVMLLGIVWPAVVLPERADYQARASRKNPYRAFGDVLRNPHARLLLGIFYLETLGFHALITLMPFLVEYVMETPGATGLYLFGAIGASLVSVPVWLPLSRRFGKARVWTATLFGKALLFVWLGTIGAGETLQILAITVLFGAASGAGAVLGPSLKADVIDTDEARTGERKEGTFFAAWGLSAKFAIGCSVMMTGVVLDLFGFEPNRAQSEGALGGMRLLSSVIPVFLHLLAVALMLRFRLDADAYHAERGRIPAQRKRALDDDTPSLPQPAPAASSSGA